ncbi:hypothetical protein [Pedobacter sp. NJ-S-72]
MRSPDGLNKLQVSLQFKIFNGLTIFGGPSYSLYNANRPEGSGIKGYKQQVAPDYAHAFNSQLRGWLGWNVGITLF